MNDPTKLPRASMDPRTGTEELAQQILADRLRTSRELVGLSQQAITDLTGIPRSAVSDIERGVRRVDSLELKRLAVIYGQSMEYLLGSDQPGDQDPQDTSLGHLARAHAGLTSTDRDKLIAFAQFLRHSAAVERAQRERPDE